MLNLGHSPLYRHFCKCLYVGMIYESLEQIFVLRQYLLIVIFVSGLVVRTDMRTFDNLFHFLEYLASFTHDGVEVFLELLDKWGIVVAYLIDDKGIGIPCLVDIHAFLCQLC